ncbi:MAG: single-stranded DNA-binding protein [Bacteroidales bacterium]|nr:single-stranded DNA-binding protein [Bacteroidales bacterium]
MINLRNRVNLIGNLGTDPEVRHFDGGKTVANIRIATSDSYKNSDGEKVTNTQWHNLVAWGSTALFVEKYLKKGNEIAIEGKLVHRSYEDKEGNKRYVTEVMVNEILMLRSKNNNS